MSEGNRLNTKRGKGKERNWTNKEIGRIASTGSRDIPKRKGVSSNMGKKRHGWGALEVRRQNGIWKKGVKEGKIFTYNGAETGKEKKVSAIKLAPARGNFVLQEISCERGGKEDEP